MESGLRTMAAAVALAWFAGCGGAQTSAQERVTLPSWGDGAPELELELPPDFTRSSKKGEDFDVHYIAPTGRAADAAHGTIYVGHHPGFFHTRETDVEGLSHVTETIHGEQVEIYSFTQAKDHTFHKEAILGSVFALSPGDTIRALRVHVACGGTSEERVAELWKYLSAVRAR
jgi:hypothetical protein